MWGKPEGPVPEGSLPEGAWEVQGGVRVHHTFPAHLSSGKFYTIAFCWDKSILDRTQTPKSLKNLWPEVTHKLTSGESGIKPALCLQGLRTSIVFMLKFKTTTLQSFATFAERGLILFSVHLLTGQTGEWACTGAGCPSWTKESQALYQHEGQKFGFVSSLYLKTDTNREYMCILCDCAAMGGLSKISIHRNQVVSCGSWSGWGLLVLMTKLKGGFSFTFWSGR